MRHPFAAAAALLALTFAAAPIARAATLAADYQFEGTYDSSVAGAPAITPVNAGTLTTETIDGQTRGVYRFSGGSGLTAATAGVISPSTYSIVLDARLFPNGSGVPGISKILDFKNRTSDAGLYTVANVPTFYNATTPVGAGVAAFPLDGQTYAQLALTRDAASLVSVYLNGALAFSFNDATPVVSDGLATIENPTTPASPLLSFFLDDPNSTIVTTGLAVEQADGAADRIRLYDGALTAAEVAALVPEPASLAGVAAVGIVALRRRRR